MGACRYITGKSFVEGQSTKAVSAQTCIGVLFIRQVSNTIFAMLFLSKSPADHLANRRGSPVVREPQFY
jgi:hypothetical protein